MLVGLEERDDAGVYKVTREAAVVQTLDFITPVVDDPYLYGQIAAANSMSDVFAMGAKVITALNIVAYDSCHVDTQMLQQILRGGLDKVLEAGGEIIGGHTVEDLEMKYGLCATGIVHPDRIIRNNTGKVGDKIILTKPLGLGVITTSIKADLASHTAIDEAVYYMTMLNKSASECAVKIGVNAMTDVTGFGLMGHLLEMTTAQKSIEINSEQVPLIESAFELAEMGMFPGGSFRNRDYISKFVKPSKNSNSEDEIMLLYDAQTSGGLLISVEPNKAEKLLDILRESGHIRAVIIGEVIENTRYRIYLN